MCSSTSFSLLSYILWFTSSSNSPPLWIVDLRYQRHKLFGISWHSCLRTYELYLYCYQTNILYPFGFSICASAFSFSVFSSFFFLARICWLFKDKIHCLWTMHALFTYLKILKMGLTALFTHLKFFLVQCFQFSVFNFSNNKFNPNRPFMYFNFFLIGCTLLQFFLVEILYILKHHFKFLIWHWFRI